MQCMCIGQTYSSQPSAATGLRGTARPPPRVSNRCTALLSLAMLAGCGGASSGGGTPGPPTPSVVGSAFAPSTGPGDIHSYFPNAVGDQWTFDYSATGSTTGSATGVLGITAQGTQTVRGVLATVLAQVDTGTALGSYSTYYFASAGGVTYLGSNESSDLLTPQLTPYVQLLFPVTTGSVSVLSATNLSAGSDAQGNPVTLDMTQRISNDQYEDITTAAGTFTGALRQTTAVSGTLRDAKLNQSFPITGTDIRWWYPGAGVIREQVSTTSASVINSSLSEVRGYVVNGLGHGVGNAFAVAGSLSPSSGVAPSPPYGHPAVGADPTGFLVVMRRVTGVPGNYGSQWLAAHIAPDGTVTAAVAISPVRAIGDPSTGQRAAVAFDGVQYLVAYEQDNNWPGGGTAPTVIGQLVSTAGQPLGTPIELATPGANSPALAYDGNRYLLAYRRQPLQGAPSPGVLDARLLNIGTGPTIHADSEFGISTPIADFNLGAPAIAFDGARYLVAWDQSVGGQAPGVYAARVASDGSLPDGPGFLVHAPESIANTNYHLPVVAAQNGIFVVVWQDYRQSVATENQLYAARVSSAGQLLDGPANGGGLAVTSVSNHSAQNPMIAAAGNTLLVAWSDRSQGQVPPGTLSFGVRGSRLSADSTHLALLTTAAGGFLMTQPQGAYAAMAPGATGTMLVWLDSTTAATIGVSALVVRPIGP